MSPLGHDNPCRVQDATQRDKGTDNGEGEQTEPPQAASSTAAAAAAAAAAPGGWGSPDQDTSRVPNSDGAATAGAGPAQAATAWVDNAKQWQAQLGTCPVGAEAAGGSAASAQAPQASVTAPNEQAHDHTTSVTSAATHADASSTTQRDDRVAIKETLREAGIWPRRIDDITEAAIEHEYTPLDIQRLAAAARSKSKGSAGALLIKMIEDGDPVTGMLLPGLREAIASLGLTPHDADRISEYVSSHVETMLRAGHTSIQDIVNYAAQYAPGAQDPVDDEGNPHRANRGNNLCKVLPEIAGRLATIKPFADEHSPQAKHWDVTSDLIERTAAALPEWMSAVLCGTIRKVPEGHLSTCDPAWCMRAAKYILDRCPHLRYWDRAAKEIHRPYPTPASYVDARIAKDAIGHFEKAATYRKSEIELTAKYVVIDVELGQPIDQVLTSTDSKYDQWTQFVIAKCEGLDAVAEQGREAAEAYDREYPEFAPFHETTRQMWARERGPLIMRAHEERRAGA